MGFIIGTTTIGPSIHTLGLDIVTEELVRGGYNVRSVTQREARHVDILMVSLYWSEQVIDYPKWLADAGIDPAKRKPLIIVGGSMTFNPWPIRGMFHYAFVGDAEGAVVDMMDAITSGREPVNELQCIISSEMMGGNNWSNADIISNVCKELPVRHYVENRNNKITRIEIARGCKAKCAFCQISKIKPYREIPPVVLKNMIYTSPTKTIALFSPDRGSYSEYEKVEEWVAKYGKRNMGTDIRLSSLRKTSIATNVRFGIEGFSERERILVKKPYKDSEIIKDVARIFREIKTPKGKPLTCITWYMILGLPGQGHDDYKQFADMLRELSDECSDIEKATIFLSCSDFMPSNHTAMEREPKDVWTDNYAMWNVHKPFLKNITIACRGGSRTPTQRLCELLVFRGGENSNKALFNISTNTKLRALIKDRSEWAGKKMLELINKCGVDTESLINGYQGAQPWDNIKVGEL